MVLAFPLDVVKTRLIAQSNNNIIYKGISDGLQKIVKKEGYLALYKGLTPTMLVVAPNAGFQFMFYKLFKSFYRKVIPKHNLYNNIGSSVLSGSLAGVCSKLLLYPLDLTRRRMQIQGFQKYRTGFGKTFECHSMMHCLLKTYKHEGISGLYKGVLLSIIKAFVSSAVNFTTFESVGRMFKALKTKEKKNKPIKT